MKVRYIIAAVVFAILAIGGLFLKHWLVPFDLAEERAKARAAGLPLSAAEFPRAIPPAGQNAATEYNALVALLKRKPANDKVFGHGSATIPVAQTAALKAYLLSRPDIAHLVHSAVAKPDADFPHKWTSDELLPYLARMRDADIWLRRESIVLAREGRFDEAVANQALGFRVAQHAGEDPLTVPYLVSIACEAITLAGMADIMREAGPDAKLDENIRKTILAYKPNRDFARCWKGETVFGMTTMLGTISEAEAEARKDAEKRAAARGRVLPKRKVPRLFIWSANEACYLHWMTLGLNAAEQPEPGRVRAVENAMDAFDRSMHSPAQLWAMILMPVTANAVRRDVLSAAQRAVLASAASVLAYRARTGRSPRKLEEAETPASADPWSGKPLGYRLDGKGFVVYSAGESQKFTALPGQPTKSQVYFRYP
jgi:hypothetical protein